MPVNSHTPRATLPAAGGELSPIACDVSDREQVRKMMDEAKTAFGRIDVLVKHAGVIRVGPVHAMTVEDFKQDRRDVLGYGLHDSGNPAAALKFTAGGFFRGIRRQTGRYGSEGSHAGSGGSHSLSCSTTLWNCFITKEVMRLPRVRLKRPSPDQGFSLPL